MNQYSKSIVVGCVSENTQKYLDQALRLLKSWRWFAGSLADVQFHVCIVDDVPPLYRQQFENYGAYVHIVPRFSDVVPVSNKLRFLELPMLASAGRVILIDCDTVVVQEPIDLICSADFAAKIADFPTVTYEIFKSLFVSFELPMPEETERCTVHGEQTIPYFNTGVLSFSRNAMTSLVPEWIHFNQQLLRLLELLPNCNYYCEQASLSLALARCRTRFKVLENRLNFPAHCLGESLDSDFSKTDPVIIHYHWLADEEGLLKPSPYKNTNARIQALNERLRQEKLNNFDNWSYWND